VHKEINKSCKLSYLYYKSERIENFSHPRGTHTHLSQRTTCQLGPLINGKISLPIAAKTKFFTLSKMFLPKVPAFSHSTLPYPARRCTHYKNYQKINGFLSEFFDGKFSFSHWTIIEIDLTWDVAKQFFSKIATWPKSVLYNTKIIIKLMWEW
jgi:hypothetical protein